MVQGAKLFKRFRNFDGSGWPSDEVSEEVGAVTIKADVAERLQCVGGAGKGNGSARKVEGVIVGVENDFDDVRVVQLLRVFEGEAAVMRSMPESAARSSAS